MAGYMESGYQRAVTATSTATGTDHHTCVLPVKLGHHSTALSLSLCIPSSFFVAADRAAAPTNASNS